MSEKVKHGVYGKAGFGERFIAILIDGIIQALIVGVLFGAGGEAGGGLGFVLAVIYNWFFWTRYDGQTPGKRIMNLRVVKENGAELSDVDALIRALGYTVSSFVFGLGYFWALFDEKGRTWHDMLAGTLVIKA